MTKFLALRAEWDGTPQDVAAGLDPRLFDSSMALGALMALSVITKNGFVYLADETGKKIATVFGGNTQKWDYAYLLAAAPDMLAALEKALPLQRSQPVYDSISAAIAKAQGQANG